MKAENIREKLNDLNLQRMLRLIYEVEPGLTILTILFLLFESIFWLITMYVTKGTIDIISNTTSSQSLILRTLLFNGLLSVLHVTIKFISSFISSLLVIYLFIVIAFLFLILLFLNIFNSLICSNNIS